ncbi:unnamed protein product [Acanthoscelides obtectus]|uniref:Uncharacterized protein n=1 Tax=Acanthoscelides obtectus TaxID=200917 RepID=A0A9P0JLG7_ACAOB|nr:unnamed protein product [Acanthoscelides obtectus]CAK1673651.1 hypothetical protein AOBTE_LOCUS29406 [Acanthoscelides obtectus]
MKYASAPLTICSNEPARIDDLRAPLIATALETTIEEIKLSCEGYREKKHEAQRLC